MYKSLFLCFALFLMQGFSLSAQPTIGLIQKDVGNLEEGYVLFAPISSTNTYLIDKCGREVKSWASTYKPGQSCYILPDGNLLRTGNNNNAVFNAGGKGGIIEKIDWNGNILWTYNISTATACQHHDIKPLPNGNILAIVWELRTSTEAIQAGRDPLLIGQSMWSEKIIEIETLGSNMGNIVWEWKLWDHMVQDFDSTKSNYGSIATHPQLLDINYQANANNPDWIHLNSIDYHPTLDQILLSSHAFDEIWIIDHSTTTAQAATHTGGNGGKGGDLLYRWGNPEAYDHGALANKKLFGQHNATWIQNGFPFEDQIMVFNNGNGRPNGNYSTIEIIDPPLNGTTYTASLPYLPNVASWTYNSGNPHNFYAQNISGAQPLSNGNILYCDGPSGTFTEINTLGNSLWTYINPVNNSGVLNQGATPTQNLVFRCSFYPSDYSGFAGKTLIGTHPIEDTNPLSNTCILSAISDESADDSPSVKIYPNPTHAIAHIQIESDTDPYFHVEIMDIYGKIVQRNADIHANTLIDIDLQSLTSGYYWVKISSPQTIITHKILLTK